MGHLPARHLVVVTGISMKPTCKPFLRASTLLLYLLATLWGIASLYPILWLILSSLKTNYELLSSPWTLPHTLRIENYIAAWNTAKVGVYFVNSVFLTLVPLIVGTILGLLAMYPLSRLNTRISFSLYMLFVFGTIIPINSLLIPLFVMFARMKLVDTHLGLLLFYTATNIPFSVFILYGFMKTVPKELDESALIDGAGFLRILFAILIPVIKPAIVTSAILNFLSKWNEFMFALTFLSSQLKRTLPCGLTYFADRFEMNYAPMFAGLVLSIMPIVIFYLLMEKQVVAGLTAGAVKG
jgi:raffinose/stachyose/melibiose transport system permease protein